MDVGGFFRRRYVVYCWVVLWEFVVDGNNWGGVIVCCLNSLVVVVYLVMCYGV